MPRSRATAANGRGAQHKRNGHSHPDGAKVSFDAFKEFEGRRYTGMKIGRGHKWRYDQGDWTETKVTPDKWEIRFNVNKRRRGKAPEGSGAPVGTEYHWYILADQTARKLDANTYWTEMVGLKYKLAHKRAGKETWSASESAQKRQLIKLLKEMIARLEAGAVTPARRAPARRAARRTRAGGSAQLAAA
jgi:hypothetical protein